MEASLTRATWRKSSYSGGSGNCVEVAGNLPGAVGIRDSAVGIRDSKEPGGPALVFPARAWQAFIDQVKSER